MKKQIATLTTCALVGLGTVAHGQLDLSDLSVSTTFGTESEYVFRGQQVTDYAFQASVETNISGAYAGVWTNQPIDHNPSGNEIDLYTGYSFGVAEGLTADVGLTYYWYPEGAAATPDRSRELKLGLAYDHPLSPAAYLYYDFDLEQTVLEFSAGYEYDTSDWVSSTTLTLSGFLGFLDADDIFAGQMGGPQVNNGYTYWGLTADWTYSFTDSANASIGIRYTGNNDDGALGPLLTGQPFGGREDNFWWGLSFTAGF